MRVEWFGQSAFHLSGEQGSVAIDPFSDMSALTGGRGIQWDYPAIAGVQADLLLVTHEHADHNAVEAIGGDPAVLRSTAGTLDSPLGEVTAIASEHDDAAGTQRGPNTIFVFALDGARVCHMGDFGQSGLREEQAAAIGEVDLLFVPACRRAGSCRCTTARRASASWSPPTSSWRAPSASCAWRRPRSRPASWSRAGVRRSSFRRRLRRAACALEAAAAGRAYAQRDG